MSYYAKRAGELLLGGFIAALLIGLALSAAIAAGSGP